MECSERLGYGCVGVGASDGVQQSKAGAYAAATQGVRDVWFRGLGRGKWIA